MEMSHVDVFLYNTQVRKYFLSLPLFEFMMKQKTCGSFLSLVT